MAESGSYDDTIAKLRVSQDEFRTELEGQIDKGEALKERNIGSTVELNEARSDYYSWDEYNRELLKREVPPRSV